jgi:hypothetical protein
MDDGDASRDHALNAGAIQVANCNMVVAILGTHTNGEVIT